MNIFIFLLKNNIYKGGLYYNIMRFINKYNNDNFNKKLASLINFDNNLDNNPSLNNNFNNSNNSNFNHIAASNSRLKQMMRQKKNQEETQVSKNPFDIDIDNGNDNDNDNANNDEINKEIPSVPEQSSTNETSTTNNFEQQDKSIKEHSNTGNTFNIDKTNNNDEMPTFPNDIKTPMFQNDHSQNNLPKNDLPENNSLQSNPPQNDSSQNDSSQNDHPKVNPLKKRLPLHRNLPQNNSSENNSKSLTKENPFSINSTDDNDEIPTFPNNTKAPISKNDPSKNSPKSTIKKNPINIDLADDDEEIPTFPDGNDKDKPDEKEETPTDNNTSLIEQLVNNKQESEQVDEKNLALINEFNNLNEQATEENPEESSEENLDVTKENLYSIAKALQEINQEPDKYIIPLDILNNLIAEEEKSGDTLAESNIEMDKLQNEKITDEEKMQEEQAARQSTILLENGVGAVITDKDKQALQALEGKIEIDDTKDNATGAVTSTDLTKVMTDTIDIIQHTNLISESPDVSAEDLAKERKDLSTKTIQKLNTSTESELQVANTKITTNPIKDIINEFTNPEELKQYILQQCTDEHKRILTNDSITNLNALQQAVSAIYNIAFNNTNLGVIENTFIMNIRDIINKFITNLYINMFNDPEIKGNRAGDSIGTVTNNNVHTFITDRFDRNVERPNGINKDKMYPFYTPLNSNNADPSKRVTLYRLVNACALKFCIEKQNKELFYDSTKTLEDLSTDRLFILKTARNKNQNLSNLTSTFANVMTFSKADKILKEIKKNLHALKTYTNNYSTQLRKLVIEKKNIDKESTMMHHQFERMSWKGFDKPLKWYDTAYDILEKAGKNPTHRIPAGQRLIIKQLSTDINAGISGAKITKDSIQYFTGRDRNNVNGSIRSWIVILYKNYIIPCLLEDINRLARAQNLLDKYQFTDAVYDQIYKDCVQYGTLNFFRVSPFFDYTEDTIPIDWFDKYSVKNQSILKRRNELTAKRIKNRILIRLAMNYNNNITDNELLAQFFQQPYAKYMIGLLCGTNCLTKSNARTFEDGSKKFNTYFLDAPKMQEYITKYLSTNKSQLENLQADIINITKTLLQNNDKLINILPKINLLEAINNIDGISRLLKGTTFSKDINDQTIKNSDKDIFTTSAINNSQDFIGYLIWRFFKGGCKGNSEYKRNLRRYILQPKVINELKDYILTAIKDYQEQLAPKNEITDEWN